MSSKSAVEISSKRGSSRAILVTGGAGFIGSHLVHRLLKEPDWQVITVDTLTYAGREASLEEIGERERHRFYHADIADREAIRGILREHRPRGIFNLAAESHVDRSIDRPDDFLHTNVNGTFALLEEVRRYWQGLPEKARSELRFVHVSTDEVYGALGKEGRFSEEFPYRPSSPYAATKAAGDHLVRAWHHTYGLPAMVTNCSNNYGPRQFPEKLIPLVILRALRGEPIPVYGRGENVRDWLHVEDHAEALWFVFTTGKAGETYNIGASCERRNIELVTSLCGTLDRLAARADGASYTTQIEYVTDRPGHDHRYAIDATKIRRELGWRPSVTLEEGLERTVTWYLENQDWCAEAMAGSHPLERLGIPREKKEAP